jgi:hypothetical protein
VTSRALCAYIPEPSEGTPLPPEPPVQHLRTSRGRRTLCTLATTARRRGWETSQTTVPHAHGGAAGAHRMSGSTSSAGGSCGHAAQTPISPPQGAGCTRTAGASKQCSQICPTAACQSAEPRAGGARQSRPRGGTAPPGLYAETLPRGQGPPGRCRARLVSGLPPGAAPAALDGPPLPACHVLLSRSGSCSSTCAAIIPRDGVACDLWVGQQATVLTGRSSSP